MMQNPTGTAMSDFIRRTVARGVPAAAAVAGHISILLALAFVGPGDVIISELPAAIAVEIVLAPPSNAAASLAVPETVLDDVAASPSEAHDDEVVDGPPEQREPQSAPIIRAAPNIISPAPPKRAAAKATAARNTSPAKRRALPVVAPIVASTGASDGPAGGSTGSVGTSVSPADVPSIWKTRLLSHLDRFKRYPDAARARRAQGTALLSFGMDRNGHVLGYWLVHSSGFPELDEEVLAMIERASPLPPAPPEMRAEVVQLVVPVRFRM